MINKMREKNKGVRREVICYDVHFSISDLKSIKFKHINTAGKMPRPQMHIQWKMTN